MIAESDGSRNLFLLDLINQGIADGSAIILATDFVANEIIDLLQARGMDVKQFIDRGVLTILDKDSIYSIAETALEAERLQNRWFSLISDVRKKSGCQSIMAIGTAKVFFDTNNLEKLLEYERRVGKNFGNVPIEAICYFDSESFSKLGLSKIIHFLDYHEYTIYQGGVYLRWHPSMILEIVNKAIDVALGQGTSILLQKTLKLVYHMDYDALVLSQPELFEEKLRDLLGKSADAVLSRVQKEITAHLSYLHKHENMDNNRSRE